MSFRCLNCGLYPVRNSHFRLPDVVHLLRFHLPIRCRICKERYYVSIFKARKVYVECKKHKQKATS